MELSRDQVFEFRQNIFRELRNELGHLKTCQTTLFLAAVTASGVLLGLVGPIGDDANAPYAPYLLLVPLLILLPLWIIFYDKARTIARIVGFLRVQEQLATENSTEGVIGWESAMQKYWKVRDGYDSRDYDAVFYCAKQRQFDSQEYSKSRESIFNSTYWSTVYSIFFIFSGICLTISFLLMTKTWGDTIRYLLMAWFFVTLIVCFAESRYRFIYKIAMKYFFNNDKIPYEAPHRKFYAIMKEMVSLVVFTGFGLLLLLFFLNITPDQIYQIIILISFASLFISIATLTFWMLTQLIKGYNGRYSYKSFQLRWEIALRKEAYIYSEYDVVKQSTLLAEGPNQTILPVPWGDTQLYLYKFMPDTAAKPVPDQEVMPIPELYFALRPAQIGFKYGQVKRLTKQEAKDLYEDLAKTKDDDPDLEKEDLDRIFPPDRDVWGSIIYGKKPKPTRT